MKTPTLTIKSTHFTPREQMILKYVEYGMTCEQIANHLFVSTETVKKHRKNMVKKLGVRNMFDVVVKMKDKNITG
ncbi:MAG: response regulator transcription factor [Cytophagales bacterium]